MRHTVLGDEREESGYITQRKWSRKKGGAEKAPIKTRKVLEVDVGKCEKLEKLFKRESERDKNDCLVEGYFK